MCQLTHVFQRNSDPLFDGKSGITLFSDPELPQVQQDYQMSDPFLGGVSPSNPQRRSKHQTASAYPHAPPPGSIPRLVSPCGVGPVPLRLIERPPPPARSSVRGLYSDDRLPSDLTLCKPDTRNMPSPPPQIMTPIYLDRNLEPPWCDPLFGTFFFGKVEVKAEQGRGNKGKENPPRKCLVPMVFPCGRCR